VIKTVQDGGIAMQTHTAQHVLVVDDADMAGETMSLRLHMTKQTDSMTGCRQKHPVVEQGGVNG
jgi:hypothetical protein